MFLVGYVVLHSGICALGSKSIDMTIIANLEGPAIPCTQALEYASLKSAAVVSLITPGSYRATHKWP
jgi:hypothetical protein